MAAEEGRADPDAGIDRTGARSLGLSGGVANNLKLRDRLATLAGECAIPFLPALPEHTGDNAGMVAFAAWIDPAPKADPAFIAARSMSPVEIWGIA